jgi:hypothetical protein
MVTACPIGCSFVAGSIVYRRGSQAKGTTLAFRSFVCVGNLDAAKACMMSLHSQLGSDVSDGHGGALAWDQPAYARHGGAWLMHGSVVRADCSIELDVVNFRIWVTSAAFAHYRGDHSMQKSPFNFAHERLWILDIKQLI